MAPALGAGNRGFESLHPDLMEANWLDEDTDLKSAGPERALGVRVPPLPLE